MSKDTELHAPAHSSQELRFGTSYESGIEIKEAQYVETLTSQKTEIATSVCEPK